MNKYMDIKVNEVCYDEEAIWEICTLAEQNFPTVVQSEDELICIQPREMAEQLLWLHNASKVGPVKSSVSSMTQREHNDMAVFREART